MYKLNIKIETNLLNYSLKNKVIFSAAEARMLATGSNEWKKYDIWPPPAMTPTPFYFNEEGKLSINKSRGTKKFSEYISDPDKPVPYTNGIYRGRNDEYMIEDQRFTATRPDVLVFETDTLTEDIVLGGRIIADLFVSTTGTDADFVVKLIDVLPGNEPQIKDAPAGFMMENMQRLVRAEVIRGKFRNSFLKSEPFVPVRLTEVKFELNDVLHPLE